MNRYRLAAAVSIVLLCSSAAALGPSAVRVSASGPDDQNPPPPSHMACAQVASLRLPDVKVTEAVAMPAATTGAIRAAHCKVTGVIGAEIRFAALLPDTWNGKVVMGGGGGFVGSVQNQAQTSVNAGFATVGTDTGHQGAGTDASWALDHFERRVNFGYLGVHRTAEVTKAVVRAYYGSDAQRHYFSGCSNGGRQAFMEAQRYPDDFDGIVAGAPAFDFVGIAAQFTKDAQAAFPDPHRLTSPLLPVETLKAIEAQIVTACDALDGVKDGLMEDPRRCHVDVATLTGLSDAQRSALRKIYGATMGKDGAAAPAQPFGGEGEAAGWPTWITGGGPAGVAPQGPSLRFAFGTQIFKYFVFNDPDWDYSQYDITNARKDARLAGTYLNATSADLSAFKAKGRKLLVWHGWSDPALTALATIEYHEQVRARDAGAGEYMRTFMMPGVLHCGGGPGPDTVDWIGAIVDWVENGKAPDRIVARKLAANGTVARTRPLCPSPQHATYKGSGSTDAAENFVCQ